MTLFNVSVHVLHGMYVCHMSCVCYYSIWNSLPCSCMYWRHRHWTIGVDTHNSAKLIIIQSTLQYAIRLQMDFCSVFGLDIHYDTYNINHKWSIIVSESCSATSVAHRLPPKSRAATWKHMGWQYTIIIHAKSTIRSRNINSKWCSDKCRTQIPT